MHINELQARVGYAYNWCAHWSHSANHSAANWVKLWILMKKAVSCLGWDKSISDTPRLSRTPGCTRQDGLMTVLPLTWESPYLEKTASILRQGPGPKLYDHFVITNMYCIKLPARYYLPESMITLNIPFEFVSVFSWLIFCKEVICIAHMHLKETISHMLSSFCIVCIWLILDWCRLLDNRFQWNLIQDTIIFIQEN